MDTRELAEDISANPDMRVVSIFIDARGDKWALAYEKDSSEEVWAAYPSADSYAYKRGVACLTGLSIEEVKSRASSW